VAAPCWMTRGPGTARTGPSRPPPGKSRVAGQARPWLQSWLR
jgi:hypothetical protein